jgi:hypothetical protein
VVHGDRSPNTLVTPERVIRIPIHSKHDTLVVVMCGRACAARGTCKGGTIQ